MNEQSQREFIEWVRRNDPFLYGVGQKVYDMTEAGTELGFINIGGLFRSIGTAATHLGKTAANIAPKILQYRQQKRVMDMQIKRAEQGLPPANVQDYTPAVKIAPEITPEAERAMTNVAVKTVRETTSGAAKWLIPGIGIALLLMGRRRR